MRLWLMITAETWLRNLIEVLDWEVLPCGYWNTSGMQIFSMIKEGVGL